MAANPNEDTEPRVQLLFVGLHRETGVWIARSGWRGVQCVWTFPLAITR